MSSNTREQPLVKRLVLVLVLLTLPSFYNIFVQHKLIVVPNMTSATEEGQQVDAIKIQNRTTTNTSTANSSSPEQQTAPIVKDIISPIIVPSDGPDSEPLEKILDAIEPTNITHSTTDHSIPLQNFTGSTCNPTSQIRILRTSPTTSTTTTGPNESKKWTIETFDQNGSKKNVGGDEYYIEFYHDAHKIYDNAIPDVIQPLAVANIKDMNDGIYQLEFVSTPFAMEQNATVEFLNTGKRRSDQDNRILLQGGGQMTVHFVFTCDIGRIPPPYKDTWKNGGHIHKSYKNIPTDISPPIRLFEKPEPLIDFAKLDQVVIVGDSVMKQFRGGELTESNESNFRSNMEGNKNLMKPLNSKTWERFAYTARVHLETGMKNILSSSPTKDGEETKKKLKSMNVAVLLGSSAWDITADDLGQGKDFEDHLESLKNLMESMKNTCEDADANVTFIWKSASPLHPHIVRREFGRVKDATNRLKYMSRRRSEDLYKFQKELCKEMNVTFLDVYESYDLLGSHALHRHATDGMHWRRDINEMILNWFYSKPEDN